MNHHFFTLRDFSLCENHLAGYPSSNENIISFKRFTPLHSFTQRKANAFPSLKTNIMFNNNFTPSWENTMDVKIILPKRASESIEMDLVYLTEVLVTNKLGESYYGFLGGKFGYGTDFENDVFFMAHCCQGFCEEDKNGNPTCQACKRECNFEHKPSGLKICWYKWIGRSQEYKPNKPTQDKWNIIFKECMESLKVVTSPNGDFSNEKEHNTDLKEVQK